MSGEYDDYARIGDDAAIVPAGPSWRCPNCDRPKRLFVKKEPGPPVCFDCNVPVEFVPRFKPPPVARTNTLTPGPDRLFMLLCDLLDNYRWAVEHIRGVEADGLPEVAQKRRSALWDERRSMLKLLSRVLDKAAQTLTAAQWQELEERAAGTEMATLLAGWRKE